VCPPCYHLRATMRCILSFDLTQHRPQTITPTAFHLGFRPVRHPCARSAHLDGRRADGNRDDGQGGWDRERPLRVHQLGRSEQRRCESFVERYPGPMTSYTKLILRPISSTRSQKPPSNPSWNTSSPAYPLLLPSKTCSCPPPLPNLTTG
jgi:hypothetical protein